MKEHKMKTGIISIALLWIAHLAFAQSGVQPREMKIFRGRSDRVEVDGRITRVVVMDESIVNARPHNDGRSVLIMGISSGKAQIRVERESMNDVVFNVTVMEETTQLAEELTEMLGNIDGVRVRALGNRVVIDGTVSIFEDYQRVQKVAEVFEEGVLNLTRFDASRYKDLLEMAIERDIGLDTVKVTVTGDRGERARLEGFVFDERDITRAVSVAKTRVQEVDNLLTLEEIMIETEVVFLQVTSSGGEDYGFNVLKSFGVDAEITGTVEQGGGGSFSMGVTGGVSARINALVNEGDARVVAKPHISTKSGGKGEFLSGGELGFAISGDTGGSLEKVEFGVKLVIEPVLRGEDTIDSTITVEVSVPTSIGDAGYSLDKFETQSIMKSKIGESVVLSGINQALEDRFQEKTPLLGSIPVLNLFFSEKTKRDDKTELVVILTPQVVRAVPDEVKEEKEKGYELIR